MFDTLFVDPTGWDLALDVQSNIALANAPYAVAQDAASACRLWLGEERYNTAAGIPYQQSLLGNLPPPALVKSWYQNAALTVPDVSNANAVLQFTRNNRTLSGQLQLNLSNGSQTNVNF